MYIAEFIMELTPRAVAVVSRDRTAPYRSRMYLRGSYSSCTLT